MSFDEFEKVLEEIPENIHEATDRLNFIEINSNKLLKIARAAKKAALYGLITCDPVDNENCAACELVKYFRSMGE